MQKAKIVVIGGGIVGLATALALVKRGVSPVLVLEAESIIASHQTGNNSGVIHSGLYYKPGSLKAQNCVIGRDLLYVFCEEYDIPYERCGKLVVATNKRELPRLFALEKRGHANGLQVMYLGRDELEDYEPHVKGLAGLWVPETGIVDYKQVAQRYAEIISEMGGEVCLNTRLLKVHHENGGMILETSKGDIITKQLVNCAGLQADRIAHLCGVDPGIRIVPFRGEYYEFLPDKKHLVNNLIYPVPDPRFPFLGVHFTRMINGGVEAGPNAVMAFKREGYRYRDVDLRDLWNALSYIGLWRLGFKYWPLAVAEYTRSLSKRAYVHALERLMPGIEYEDIVRGGAGVRAQALRPNGKLVDDFYIVEGQRSLHVLNAPSPAATSSLSIGESLADRILKNQSAS